MNNFSKLIIAGLFLLLISGCVTYTQKQFKEPLQNQTDEYVNLQMRYIPREELEDRAGRYMSPFIVPDNTLDSREFIVLEFIIKNKTQNAMVINLNDIELQTRTGDFYPKNAFQLKQFWEPFDVSSSDRSVMNRQIDNFIFDRKIRIPKDGLKRGFLLYYSTLAKYGEFTVKVPILSSIFDFKLYSFDFEYFEIDKDM